MRNLQFTILFLIGTNLNSQTDLGIGLISINFDEQRVLEFYPDTLGSKPDKIVEIINDPSINSWNIKDCETQQEWLKPEVFWLDYMAFSFRCLVSSREWYKVMVNNETGTTLWLRNSEMTEFKNWQGYLKSMLSVTRSTEFPQNIRVTPTDDALEIDYLGSDCFSVISMSGDWIEISTPDYCEEIGNEVKTSIISGWLRWRNGNKLLIDYYLTN